MSATTHFFESPIDRWTAMMDKFLAEMPDLRCERHVVLALNGYGSNPRCQQLAVIGLPDFHEVQLCPACLDDFEKGKLESYR